MGRAFLLLTALAISAFPQTIQSLMDDAKIKKALEAARVNEPHVVDEQIRICEIPAPPFMEEARSKEFERLFRQLGLQEVRIDKAGNVIGVRPGAAPHPNLLFEAHLDTVFPE